MTTKTRRPRQQAETVSKPSYLTPKELAELLRISKSSVYGHIARGRIRAVRFGNLPRIPIAEVERIEREGL